MWGRELESCVPILALLIPSQETPPNTRKDLPNGSWRLRRETPNCPPTPTRRLPEVAPEMLRRLALSNSSEGWAMGDHVQDPPLWGEKSGSRSKGSVSGALW